MMDRRKFIKYIGAAGAAAAMMKPGLARAASHKLGAPTPKFVLPP